MGSSLTEWFPLEVSRKELHSYELFITSLQEVTGQQEAAGEMGIHGLEEI